MKKIFLLVLFLLSVNAIQAQQVNAIATRCPYPYRIYYSSVRADATGNIVYTPCPVKANVFTGAMNYNLTTFDVTTTGNIVIVSGGTMALSGNSITLRDGTTAGLRLNSSAGTTQMGDLSGGTSTVTTTVGTATMYGTTATQIGPAPGSIMIDYPTDTLTTSLTRWNLGGSSGPITFNYNRTVTPAGTTGPQTINKAYGTVNFAPGTSTLLVTNSIATSTSIIFVTTLTNDTTCYFKNVVPNPGQFTIIMTGNCQNETAVGFQVTN